MNTTTGLMLSAVIGLMGSVDVRLRRAEPLDHSIFPRPQRPIFDPDDGEGRTFEQDKPRIDPFAKAMKENAAADAYVIAYGGLVSYKNEARIRLNCIRKYLVTAHKISGSRLKLIDGGHAVEVKVQLFLVNPSDPKPSPFPTVNREAVQMRKAPKHPCGKPEP